MEIACLGPTFEVVNLRLQFLFPGSVVTQDRRNFTVAATFSGGMCLALLECGQQGGEVDARDSNYVWWVLQRN